MTIDHVYVAFVVIPFLRKSLHLKRGPLRNRLSRYHATRVTWHPEKTAAKETALKKTLTGPRPINVRKLVLRERREKHCRIKIPFQIISSTFPSQLFRDCICPASFACCPVSETLAIALWVSVFISRVVIMIIKKKNNNNINKYKY